MLALKETSISQRMRLSALPAVILIAIGSMSSIAAEKIMIFNENQTYSIDNQIDEKPKYDGLYQSGPHESQGIIFYEYLRFYESGAVVSTSSTGTIEQVAQWLNLSADHVGSGSYEITRGKIQARVRLQPNEYGFGGGRIDYKGKIEGNILNLYIQSHTLHLLRNDPIHIGQSRRKYQFYPVDLLESKDDN